MNLKVFAFTIIIVAVLMLGEATEVTPKNLITKEFFKTIRSWKRSYEFFNEMNCTIPDDDINNKMQIHGYVKWRPVKLHCRNLESVVISSVLCDKYCYDPDNNYTKMPRLKAVSVKQEQTLTDRHDVKRRFEKPVACNCNFKKKKDNKCKKNHSKNNKKSKQAKEYTN